MRTSIFIVILAGLPFSATAQDLARPNTILISASGKAETPPDIATLSLTMRGEGKTPDAATTALSGKQKAVFAGLQKLDPKMIVRTGSVSIREVRKGDCNGSMATDAMTMMADNLEAMADEMDTGGNSGSSKGPCRIVGALAETRTEIVLTSIKDAGTAVGLAGRLGAASAEIQGFGLRDQAPALQRALFEAMANARAKAEIVARASGAKLGALVSVVDGDSNIRNRYASAPQEMVLYNAPPSLMQPVALAIAPTPVETTAQLVVSFAIEK
ncbi:SIMPL domain-containing protein [Sphingomonas sp. GB1N7]|uniref:SIMPL domain-containing protein n=1 Tax=Parasphingomonas caseinilytica TaxID=3096158 RepID=UPI002FCA869E